MTKTTRERKLKFIESFGRNALHECLTEALHKYGESWLTDEQINDLTRDQVADAREAARRNIRNRKIRKTNG